MSMYIPYPAIACSNVQAATHLCIRFESCDAFLGDLFANLNIQSCTAMEPWNLSAAVVNACLEELCVKLNIQSCIVMGT